MNPDADFRQTEFYKEIRKTKLYIGQLLRTDPERLIKELNDVAWEYLQDFEIIDKK